MGRIVLWGLSACLSTLVFAGEAVTISELTAAQIVEKNVAARGGAEAWRKIETMVWAGHIETANAPVPVLPFILELKRPNKTRFQVSAQNQASVRAYDGSNGWKLRPTSSGKPDLQPYSADELNFARDGNGIDGLLMDYQAKGIAVALDGVDDVEGKKAYRLSVKLPSGASHHMWIDAQSFLDIKSDREWRNASGQTGTVSVSYRNYQTFEGLQIPTTIETGAGTSKAPDKMVIEKISLNPPLDDRAFAKPTVPARRNVVTVRAEPDSPIPRPARPAPIVAPRLSGPGPESAPGATGSK